MPKRNDIKSILIIGSGPIIIGQACEFDYSGTQACKSLKEEGYEVILVNSNPASIMTDPDIANKTYIEPINWKTIKNILIKEKPDAILPTMGGQTALNCAIDLAKNGILKDLNIEIIGANEEAIRKAEDRKLFRESMNKIGLECPKSKIVHSIEEAKDALQEIGFPNIIRPSFTMGGTGGGIAYNYEEFFKICKKGLDLSPTQELLIDESIIGWKEFEMEVIRDKKDNCIIVCSIENIDPMGVHTGDSITVAPAQTLNDTEYQNMRNASIKVLKEIGVDTGGSNVQFAINPINGKMLVVEMNPRVSRSSALASKATGFPIAEVAAKLAVGYTLDELKNKITMNKTPASFEPSMDYIITKIPRFNFDKFPNTNNKLTTQMKSVGEVMAVGRTFQESLQKAIKSLEINRDSVIEDLHLIDENCNINNIKKKIEYELRFPTEKRLWYIGSAFKLGWSIEKVHSLSKIDPWFLYHIKDLVEEEFLIKSKKHYFNLDKDFLYKIKKKGFSDSRIAYLLECHEHDVYKHRKKINVLPVFKRVDTCSAEFPTETAYMYSTYDEECESRPTKRKKIIVLGSGPNRIGQGIEFDCCCVHAVLSMKSLGYETIIVNCNPETVSTDYDITDRLYFEPITLEHVVSIIEKENPYGIIVHYGGQTPLKLAKDLEKLKFPIIGTSSKSIDIAEDRDKFQALVKSLNIKQPLNSIIKSKKEGYKISQIISYPIIVRPSYVLGGQSMEIIHNIEDFSTYLKNKDINISNDNPLLIDKFLSDSIEVDIDIVSDGEDVLIGGIMEHIEQAGIHSGDSACCIPPHTLSLHIQEKLIEQVILIAKKLNIIGLMNAQFAIKGNEIFIIEINPRASRTIPFISKATGISIAKIAAKCMAGISLAKQKINFSRIIHNKLYSVKQPIFPFSKFSGVDPILGPEMKSTGEVMGIGESFGEAFSKSFFGDNKISPDKGYFFISVKDSDKKDSIDIARQLIELNFKILATDGTKSVLNSAGILCKRINKVQQGRPNIVDMIKNKEIVFICNTTEGKQAISDSFDIRRSAIRKGIMYTTTISGGKSICAALKNKEINKVRDIKKILL